MNSHALRRPPTGPREARPDDKLRAVSKDGLQYRLISIYGTGFMQKSIKKAPDDAGAF
jgi:hypothetical protein